MKLNNQQKGSLLAFIAVFLITPDSLFIRLSNIDTWGLLFYRGAIPFVTVLLSMLLIYRMTFFKLFFAMGYPGIFYTITFAVTNITFLISIQNTNVANTLIMIAMAPMISAILGALFLKENPDKKTWTKIFITFMAAIYIFYDSLDAGDILGNALGLLTALGLAVGAVIVRSKKKISLVPSAMVGKLLVALTAFYFADNLNLKDNDLIIVPLMSVMCVAIPFVLVTLAPRYITAAEVNLFFLLETILGPIWVWLVIKEQPSIVTILGGIVIIITIAAHSTLSLKKHSFIN